MDHYESKDRESAFFFFKPSKQSKNKNYAEKHLLPFSAIVSPLTECKLVRLSFKMLN